MRNRNLNYDYVGMCICIRFFVQRARAFMLLFVCVFVSLCLSKWRSIFFNDKLLTAVWFINFTCINEQFNQIKKYIFIYIYIYRPNNI